MKGGFSVNIHKDIRKDDMVDTTVEFLVSQNLNQDQALKQIGQMLNNLDNDPAITEEDKQAYRLVLNEAWRQYKIRTANNS